MGQIHRRFGHFAPGVDKGQLPVILSVGMEDTEHTKFVRAMHRHDDRLELLLIQQGNGIHTINGKQYHVAKGDVLIYNCNIPHDECGNTEFGMDVYSCAMTNIHVNGLPPNCLIPNAHPPILQSAERFQEIESIFAMMYDFTMQDTPHAVEVATYLGQALLTLVLELSSKQQVSILSEEQALGDQIRHYIDRHFLENISLQSIADALYLNQYYMAHVFKSTSGYSPTQYIIRRRLGEAQSYLLQTNKSITDIAMIVGFNNANHFHTTFQKVIGITPGKYRKIWNDTL